MRELMEKTASSLRREGILATAQKGKNYICDHIGHRDALKNCFVDVLFINGCTLPHPMRYRVSHQQEQLRMANITSNVVYFEELEMEMVNLARVFVFFRCPYTDVIGQFIEQAKKYNKTVVFDIDDLVFDRVYTDTVRYVQQMKDTDRRLYDAGVERIGRTLALCGIATTTTEALADELRKYADTVYVNRNVASDQMVMLSEQAMKELDGAWPERKRGHGSRRRLEKRQGQVSIGYFSGSITHNDDFAFILPALIRIMKENTAVHLYLVGELDLPGELEGFKNRIHSIGFMDWKELPFILAQMDINLAPLEDTVFNRAKSENKWVEASLVKVITLASSVGAFKRMIRNGETGVLCQNSEEDWYREISQLIRDSGLRRRIAEAAYRYVLENCITIETSRVYGEFIKSIMTPNVMFKIPTAQISGGNIVAQRHALVLQKNGMDVSFINDGGEEFSNFACYNTEFPIIRSRSGGRFSAVQGSIDTAVATLYTTVEFVQDYPNIGNRIYLVQGLETMFPPLGSMGRIKASQSYMPIGDFKFITVSKWCQKWLHDKYLVEADYIPNGIDISLFRPVKRDFSGRIRILIEGNSEDPNKNTDESFHIVEFLDPEKYEIWYVSNLGKPKEWYRVNRFFRKVPNAKMPQIYRKCHILLKSSIQESFSYPPLEMLATGGLVVARKNDGNAEYLTHEENCLFYDPEKPASAADVIERLLTDEELRNRLCQKGIETAGERDWSRIDADIWKAYH